MIDFNTGFGAPLNDDAPQMSQLNEMSAIQNADRIYTTFQNTGLSSFGDQQSLQSNPVTFAQNLLDRPVQTQSFQPAGYQDPIFYSKEKLNFDRYYNHPKYNTLGFHPFRDNETYYNENSHWTDDYVRMGSQFGTLFASGFVSTYDTIGDIFTGNNLAFDDDISRAYEKASAIGTSSRGGLVGFGNNLLLNSAYTLGIVTEFALTELALAGITAATGGGAAPATGAAAIGKAGQFGRAVTNVWDVFKATNSVARMRQAASAAKDAGKMRQFFTAVGTGLNPLENTISFGKSLLTTESELSKMSNLAKASTGFGSFYRDVKKTSMAWSESKLEAGMVEADVRKTLTDQYIQDNGFAPVGEDAQRISELSYSSGLTTAMYNFPLIYGTNAITFGTLFKGYKPLKEAAELAGDVGVGKSMRRTAAKGVLFEDMPGKAKQFVELFTKPSVSRTFGYVGRYTSANFSEGLQEIGQEIIAGAAKDYYENLFDSPAYAQGRAWSDSLAKATKDQMSAQGLEVFFSGFLMGGVAGPYTKMLYGIPNVIQRMQDPKAYKQRKAEIKAYKAEILKAANEIGADPDAFYNAMYLEMARQKELGDMALTAAMENNQHAFQNIKDASAFDRAFALMKSGALNEHVDFLRSMKDLSAEELKDAFPQLAGKSQEETLAKVDELIDRFEKLGKDYVADMQGFQNPYKPHLYKEDKAKYRNEKLKYETWEELRRQRLFYKDSAERHLDRIESMMNVAKEDPVVGNMAFSDYALLFDEKALVNEIDNLNAELEIEATTDEQKELLAKKQERVAALNRLKDSLGKRKKDGTFDRRYNKQLFDSYLNFLNTISETPVDEGKAKKTFELVKDAHNLRDDAVLYQEMYNMLADPQGSFYSATASKVKSILEGVQEEQVKNLNKVLDNLEVTHEDKAFLEMLARAGVVVSKEDLDDFLKRGKVPTRLMDAKDTSKEIDPKSELYQQAIALISLHAAQKNRTTTEETKTEAEGAKYAQTEDLITVEELSEVTPLFQSLIENLYKQEVADRQARNLEPISYNEFIGSAVAQRAITAITLIDELYRADNEQSAISPGEWLQKNRSREDVYQIVNDNGFKPEELLITGIDPNVFALEEMPEGFTLETTKGEKGIFVRSTSALDTETGEENTVFELVDNKNNVIPGTEPSLTLDEALKKRKELAKKRKDQAAEFEFDGKSFRQGDVVNDGRGNDYIVVNSAEEMNKAKSEEGTVSITLRNKQTGALVKRASSTNIFPGSFASFKSELAYIQDVNNYNMMYGFISDVDRTEEAIEKYGSASNAATARMKQRLSELSEEELNSRITIRITQNDPAKIKKPSKLRINGKENPNIEERGEKYAILILLDGQELGFVRSAQNFQFIGNDGKKVPIYSKNNGTWTFGISFDLFNRVFNLPGQDMLKAYSRFQLAMSQALNIQTNVSKIMQGKTEVELSNEETLELFGRIKLTEGSYDFAKGDERATYDELASKTVNGGTYLIDYRPVTEGGVYKVAPRILTDLTGEALDEAEAKINAAIENMNGHPSNMGRYILAVEINGKIKFVPFVSQPLTEVEVGEVLADLQSISNDAAENNSEGTDLTYTDAANQSVLYDKLYHAHGTGLYSRMRITADGSFVVEVADNPGFSDPKILLKKDAGSEIGNVSSLIEEMNAEVPNLPKKFRGIKFSNDMFRASLPQDFTVEQFKTAPVVATVSADIVKSNNKAIVIPAKKVKAETMPGTGENTPQGTGNDLLGETETTETEETTEAPGAADLIAGLTVDQIPAPSEEAKSENQALFEKRNELQEQLKAKRKSKTDALVTMGYSRTAASKQADQDPDVLALQDQLNKVKAQIISRANKVVPLGDRKFTEKDVEDIEAFKAWVNKNLPSSVTVEVIDTLIDNLYNGHVTVGQFVMKLMGISNQIQGSILVNPLSPDKYHEAFHAVFRMFLTDEEIQKHLDLAKAEVKANLKKQNKTLDQAIAELKASSEIYQDMSYAQLEERLYEEYLADRFQEWKTNKKTPTAAANKSLFRKIVDFIKEFFKSFRSTNEMTNLFEAIDSGKYSNKTVENNRFTSVVEEGGPIVANKTIKIGSAEVLTKDGSIKVFNKYLGGDRATGIIASIAGIFAERREDPKNNDKSDQEIYDSIFDDYLEAYDYDSEIYREREDFEDIREDLEMMYSLFDDADVRQQMIEGTQEFLEVLAYVDQQTEDEISEMSDDIGDKSTTDSRKESESIGGFKSLPSFLRRYIATTRYTNVNEYGVPLDNLYSVVESGIVYNGLLKALSNTTNEKDALAKLALFNRPGTQTGAFITRFFEDAGIVVNEDGTVSLDNLTKPELVLNVLKGFEKFKIDYKYIGLDPSTQAVRVLDANRRDDTRTIFSLWNAAFERKRKFYGAQFNAKAATALEELNSAIQQGASSEKIVEVVKNLEDIAGIRISPVLVEYTIAVNAENKTDAQQYLIELNKNVEPIDTEGISYLATDVRNGKNIFSRESSTDTTLEGAKSSGGRTYKFAKSASAFDETVGANSWVNAEGETVYGYQSPTFNHKRLEDIKDPVKLMEMLQDAFMTNNFLLNSEAFKSLLPGLKLDRIDGLRLEYLAQSVSETFKRGETYQKGTTLGSMSPMQYLVTNLTLYSVGETKVIGEGVSAKTVATSTHNVGVIEASNTADVVSLPVIKAVNTKNGKTVLSDEAVDLFITLIEAEAKRISRVAAETDPEFIKAGYNTPNSKGKAKGLQLTTTIPYVGELRQAIEDGAAEGKELLEIVSRKEIAEQLQIAVNSQITGIIEQLIDEGLVYRSKEGKYEISAGVPQFVKEGFKEVKVQGTKGTFDAKKNSLYNLQQNNIYHNLAQIIVNDIINTKAFSALLKGDIAESVKMNDENYSTLVIDEVKRNKGLNANGVSAYTSIVAKNLGINHSTEEFDVLTIKDPTKLGKFTGSEVEQADGQTWGTVKALRHMLFGFGKLTQAQADFLTKIENGEDISAEEIFGKNGSIKRNGQTNSLKIVYFDGKTYIKTSFFVLTKALTSDPTTDFTTPLPGREELHNLRTNLEQNDSRNRISIAVPVSASKGMKVNIADNPTSATKENFFPLNSRYLTLQQENPSNKLEITDPSQIKILTPLEQDPNLEITFRGVPVKSKDLVNLYGRASGTRVTIKYQNRKMTVFGFKEFINDLDAAKQGTISADLAKFVKYASQIMKGTGGSAQAIDLFELDDNGQLKADLNNSIVEAKFIELYMAYFTGGVLREKIPGLSLTLVSNYGIKVVKQALEVDKEGNVTRWKVLSDKEGVGVKDEIVDGDFKVGSYFVDDLKHDVAEYNEKGEPTGERYTEVLIPAHFKEFHNFEGEIPAAIAKMFGIRIPSQDKHSTINIRVVGFLPSYYGSVIVAPHELIEISGADFDVDKLYTQIKEWYMTKDGTVREYGSATSDFGKYLEYLLYSAKDKQVRDLLKNEVETLEELVIDALEFVKFKTQDRKNLSDKLAGVAVALKQLGRPASFKEYQDAVENNGGMDINIGALNNYILDAKTALTFNEHTTKPQTGTVAPVKQANRVEVVSRYSNADVTANPDKIYVFGDNTQRKGTGGQAQIRNNENAFGIATKIAPNNNASAFMSDDQLESNKAVIDADIAKIKSDGRPVVLPKDGFGTGLARLKEKAPKTYDYLKQRLQEEFGFNNDTGKVQPVKQTGKTAVERAPIAYQVAHIDPIQEAINEIIAEIPGAEEIFSEETFDPHGLLGKYFAFKNNKEGSRNIGAAVLGNISYATLQKMGEEDYASTLTEDGKRKAYIISALITAMTDNAKERLAARAGLSIDGLTWVTMKVAKGWSLKNALLYVNQPIVRDALKRFNDSKGQFTTSSSFRSIELSLAKAYRDEKDFGIDQLKAEIKRLKPGAVNTATLAGNLINPDPLVNLSIISDLLSLTSEATYFADIAKLGNMVKGFDYDGVYTIQESIQRLNGQKSPYDLNNISDPLQLALMEIHQDILQSLPYVIKRSTGGVSEAKQAVAKTLTGVGTVRQRHSEDVTKDVMSYFDLMAYMHYLRKTGKKRALASLNNKMIYKEEGKSSVVDLVEILREKYPDNYFLNNYLFTVKTGEEGNNTGIDYIQTNSWAKLSQDQISKLQNSFVELFNENDSDLALDLFHYLLVKDAGRFRSGSFLNILPGFIMEDFFKATTPVTQALRINTDEAYQEVFGSDKATMLNYFTGYYVMNQKFVSKPYNYFKDVSDLITDGQKVVTESNGNIIISIPFEENKITEEVKKYISSSDVIYFDTVNGVGARLHAPTIIRKGKEVYAISSVLRNKAERELARDNNGGVWGTKLTYVKIDSGTGSLAASPVGFAFGALKKNTVITAAKEDNRSQTNPSGNSAVNDRQANTAKPSTASQGGPINYIEALEDEFEIVRAKGLNYISAETGNPLNQYKGITPQALYDKLKSAQPQQEFDETPVEPTPVEEAPATNTGSAVNQDAVLAEEYNKLSDEIKAKHSLDKFKLDVKMGLEPDFNTRLQKVIDQYKNC